MSFLRTFTTNGWLILIGVVVVIFLGVWGFFRVKSCASDKVEAEESALDYQVTMKNVEDSTYQQIDKMTTNDLSRIGSNLFGEK